MPRVLGHSRTLSRSPGRKQAVRSMHVCWQARAQGIAQNVKEFCILT